MMSELDELHAKQIDIQDIRKRLERHHRLPSLEKLANVPAVANLATNVIPVLLDRIEQNRLREVDYWVAVERAESAEQRIAELENELDALHAKAHRIQLRQEAAEAEAVRLRAALGRVRQGFLNILDCRRFEFGDEFRYGALHRQEVETEIKLLDAALGGLLTPTASDEAEAR